MSGSKEIEHDADGSRSIWFEAYISKSSYGAYDPGWSYLNAQIPLSTIPRASVPTAGTQTIGQTLTINTNRKSTSFTHNLYYSFAQSVFDKYKYILLIIIVILLIAFIEIQIAQNISDCSYYLDKDRIMKIKPPCLSLDENDYIYIYNNDSFDKSTVIEKCNIPKGYKKRSIPKHFTTYLNKPYRKIKGAFKEVFNSTTPINNLTDGIIKCYSFRNKINIPSGYVSLNSNWIMIYPAKINIKCFIVNNKVMFAE